MPSLSPDEFAEFLKGTVLEDLVLWEAFVWRPPRSHLPERALRFGFRARLVEAEENRAVVDASHGVLVRPPDGPPVRIEVTYRVTYRTPRQMTEEIFRLFRRVTLRLHTVPFAREWFRDVSGRMGIPPVVLPLELAHPAAVPPEVRERIRSRLAPATGAEDAPPPRPSRLRRTRPAERTEPAPRLSPERAEPEESPPSED